MTKFFKDLSQHVLKPAQYLKNPWARQPVGDKDVHSA
jgi:hypothetical protein